MTPGGVRKMGGKTRWRIVEELKSAGGLPVRELAERLGMSYMGVKDACTDLQKRGLLETWRHSVGSGRPQMLYRLTDKALDLFPAESLNLALGLLEAANSLYGSSAAEKLLVVAFQKMRERYARRLSGVSSAARGIKLAEIRDREGYMARWEEEGGEGGGWRIVEHHSPILEIQRAFPITERLEAELFQRLLECRVSREVSEVPGLYRVVYTGDRSAAWKRV
jgi:predicted ArsR family transcriptional regulator